MLASELGPQHVGQDLTITVSGICTGGIIRSVSQTFGMITVDLDGQLFTLDEDKDVILTQVSIRDLILTEPDAEQRAVHIRTLELISA